MIGSAGSRIGSGGALASQASRGALMRPYRVGSVYWLMSVGMVARARTVRVTGVREPARGRGRGARRRAVEVHFGHREDPLGRLAVRRAERLHPSIANRPGHHELEPA